MTLTLWRWALYSPALLAGVGVDALVYPAKGYSATLPLRAGSKVPAPKGSIGRREKVVFTTIGNRLRIAGTAELNGFDTSLNTVRCEALTRRAKHHFPDLCEWDQVNTGPVCVRQRRPTCRSSGSQSSESLPQHRSRHLGWTEGASARALADIIAGDATRGRLRVHQRTGS